MGEEVGSANGDRGQQQNKPFGNAGANLETQKVIKKENRPGPV
jgi:hypothetical protein